MVSWNTYSLLNSFAFFYIYIYLQVLFTEFKMLNKLNINELSFSSYSLFKIIEKKMNIEHIYMCVWRAASTTNQAKF